MQRFAALSKPDRREWERVVNTLGIRQTGQSLYVSLALNPQLGAWPTVVADTGTYLLHPEVIET